MPCCPSLRRVFGHGFPRSDLLLILPRRAAARPPATPRLARGHLAVETGKHRFGRGEHSVKLSRRKTVDEQPPHRRNVPWRGSFDRPPSPIGQHHVRAPPVGLAPEFDSAVERWLDWATDVVESWPDDISTAEPEWEALAAMADRVDTTLERRARRLQASAAGPVAVTRPIK